MRNGLSVATLAAIMLVPPVAEATVWVHVPDLGQLKYQVSSEGYVWLRNLHEFDNRALGCCYNYYINTNTQEGKNTWALVLSLMAQSKGLYIGLPDGFAAGAVSMSGDW